MAFGEFSPELCEQLFAVPKTLASRIEWKRGQGKDVLIFQAKVLTPDGLGLDLAGHWKKNGRHNRTYWGFNLTYLGYCIRSYDMAIYHRNPGQKIRGPHKHKYSSSLIDRFAYKPDPPLSEDDANETLLDFLKEANIALPHDYQYMIFP